MEREVEIVNRLGLHARAAARFVQAAARFDSEIWVLCAGRQVSGKSIMGLMMLAASKGRHITLIAEGPDAADALDALALLIADRFGEDS